jgi:hypothetical protein
LAINGAKVAGDGWGMETPMTAHKVGDHVELDKDEARAGQSGTGVRIVLMISTILVLLGFALVALLQHS